MLPELKPYLTALVIPPTPLLIIAFMGTVLIAGRPKFAKGIILSAVSLLWLLSTNGFSVWLHHQVIPEYSWLSAKDIKEKNAQAIVVLGGGVITGLPGEGEQMSKLSLERLKLGAQLARQTGLPLVFSGGTGLGAKDSSIAEADVAEIVLNEAFGVNLNFKESRSRDTKENAANTWDLLSKQGILQIVLVTHSYHMPRACFEFNQVGFTVNEASVGKPTINSGTLLRWIPSASSLEVTQSILRELLAQMIQKMRRV